MITWSDIEDATGFVLVASLPVHDGHHPGPMDGLDAFGRAHARTEWMLGTPYGRSFTQRYIAGPQGGSGPVPFEAWEANVVEDMAHSWESWPAERQAWSDDRLVAWASAPLRGTRLDHLTGGTVIVDLHGQRHLPTVLVATTLSTASAHGKTEVLARCNAALIALAPEEATRMRFHALWT